MNNHERREERREERRGDGDTLPEHDLPTAVAQAREPRTGSRAHHFTAEDLARLPRPRARFLETRGIVLPLVVDDPGGVRSVGEVLELLFMLRVQVVATLALTVRRRGQVWEMRICDFDGGPLDARRQREIVDALESVLGGSGASRQSRAARALQRN